MIHQRLAEWFTSRLRQRIASFDSISVYLKLADNYLSQLNEYM